MKRLVVILLLVATAARANNGVGMTGAARTAMVPVFVEPFGPCSGTIVNDVPEIVTAAHCLVHERPLPRDREWLRPLLKLLVIEAPAANLLVRLFLTPSRILVGIDEKVYPVESYFVHPSYLGYLKTRLAAHLGPAERAEEAAGNVHDLAVLRLAKGTPVPAVAPLVDESLPEGHPVTVAGWGYPMGPGDYDRDGVENNSDPCPLTPRDAKAARNGCAPGESPVDLGWGFRFGPNRVSEVDEDRGLLTIERELEPSAAHWRDAVTPGANESGGTLLSAWGALAGVVKGTRAVKAQGALVLKAYYVDVRQPENFAFLSSRLTRFVVNRGFEDTNGIKLPPYPLR